MNLGKQPLRLSRFPQRAWDAMGILLLAGVLAALCWRQAHLLVIPGDMPASRAAGRNGMADFQDVIYYPLRALRDGVNPYDCRTEPLSDGSPRYRQRYPALHAFPLYSPLLFVLYWPFAWGEFVPAAMIYAALNVALLITWAYYCWRTAGVLPSIAQVTILSAVMLATQSGRANFLGGETAIPLALASLGAVVLAPCHPWLAGLALALTSLKPTFGLPLGVLLLAGQHYRSVALGWGLGFVIGVAGLAIIFARSGDLPEIVEILRHNQSVLESDPQMDARTSAVRFDTASAIQRWLPWGGEIPGLLASLAVLGIASAALWRLSRLRGQPEVEALSAAIVALATVSSIYHLGYDALLLWGAIVVVALAPAELWPSATRGWRWLVGGLIFVPMINFLGSRTVGRLWLELVPSAASLPQPLAHFGWTVICTLNGLVLLAALVLLARQAWRIRPVGA